MIDSLINKVVKKFVIGKVNGLLSQYKNDVDKVRSVLTKWIGRLKKVLSYFESLLAKIEDNELSETELKDSVEEITVLIKEW